MVRTKYILVLNETFNIGVNCDVYSIKLLEDSYGPLRISLPSNFTPNRKGTLHLLPPALVAWVVGVTKLVVGKACQVIIMVAAKSRKKWKSLVMKRRVQIMKYLMIIPQLQFRCKRSPAHYKFRYLHINYLQLCHR